MNIIAKLISTCEKQIIYISTHSTQSKSFWIKATFYKQLLKIVTQSTDFRSDYLWSL